MIFILFISFIILQRIGELLLSKRNEKWLLQNGAVEYGSHHYKFIVSLHILFIFSLIFEYNFRPTSAFSLFLLIFYFILLCFKAWVIFSLGKFWNTKIYHISNVPLIKNGPYKFIKHPNYLIVIGEIMVIPLVFGLYCTAVIFTVINGIMLCIRIKEENRALGY